HTGIPRPDPRRVERPGAVPGRALGRQDDRRIDHDPAPAEGGALRARLAHAATAGEWRRPRRRGEGLLLEQVALAPFVALDRELDEAVEELRVRDPRGLEQARVEARSRKPRDRVQLVHDDLAVVGAGEHVCPDHALAVAGAERVYRE